MAQISILEEESLSKAEIAGFSSTKKETNFPKGYTALVRFWL
jgi:hypothetical protein